MKKSNNKQMGESTTKGSNPDEKEKEYTFPSLGITIKATSLEEARKKIETKIKGDADDGDK